MSRNRMPARDPGEMADMSPAQLVNATRAERKAAQAAIDAPPKQTRNRRSLGANEKATRRSLAALGELPAGLESLGEVALTLARALDEGAGLATAAVARELRAVMTQLAKGVADAHDDGPDPAQQVLDELSKPL